MSGKSKTSRATVKERKEQANMSQVRWDDSKMRNTYANVCNVSSTREEVTLLFGTNKAWNAGQQALTVDLTDRMVLNPYTAKRLSILLSNLVTEYESRFGEIEIGLPETPSGG